MYRGVRPLGIYLLREGFLLIISQVRELIYIHYPAFKVGTFGVGVVLVCVGWPRDDDTKREPILSLVRNNFKKINPKFGNIPLFSGKGAYTDNKSEITLCLVDPDTNQEYDPNTIMYVALHELAHVVSEGIGHGEEFRQNFSKLLLEGEKLGFYDPTKPMTTTYCGIKS